MECVPFSPFRHPIGTCLSATEVRVQSSGARDGCEGKYAGTGSDRFEAGP